MVPGREGLFRKTRWREPVRFLTLAVLLFTVLHCPPAGAEGENLLREEFDTLERWEPLTFPRIKKHSTYTIEPMEGGACLRTESEASASGIVLRGTFPVHEFPRLRWRWMAENVYEAGDARTKDGDDYPLRLYIVFPFDPGTASWREKVSYKAARILYGKYPPQSALNYIWANREHEEKILPNPFAKNAMMIILRGPGDVGTWQEEEVDIVADYRRAFGEDPPARAGLAIMNDSDGTGESSVSYVDYIEVCR